jgi:hypothetical protein
MGGLVILPPNYVAHVGRPTKNRRKALGEVDARGGGKKMSRHGVIMHCGNYGEPGHNRGGYHWIKVGLEPPSHATSSTPPSTMQEPDNTGIPVLLHQLKSNKNSGTYSNYSCLPVNPSQESTNTATVRRAHVAVEAMAQQVTSSFPSMQFFYNR